MIISAASRAPARATLTQGVAPSRVAARLPHLTAHDVAEIDAEVRVVLTEIGNGGRVDDAYSSSNYHCGHLDRSFERWRNPAYKPLRSQPAV
jgi:hypothetical protein